MTAVRHGPFWDMIEGRRPAPPAARTLGWRLLAIDPEAGTIRVEFDAGADFLNPVGTVQGGFLAAMLHRGRDIMFLEGTLADADGRTIATASATARIIPFGESPAERAVAAKTG